MSVLMVKRTRRLLLAQLAAAAAVTSLAGIRRASATAQGDVVTPDGRVYTAYVPAATKPGQFYQYSCEFDAAWVVLSTFGQDVSFEDQLAVVGYDTSVEPYSEQTEDGFIIYGGDITSAFCGDYTSSLLARSTGTAFLPLFKHYGLGAETVTTRDEIESTLDRGGLIWTKATVDFLPWDATDLAHSEWQVGADRVWQRPRGRGHGLQRRWRGHPGCPGPDQHQLGTGLRIRCPLGYVPFRLRCAGLRRCRRVPHG